MAKKEENKQQSEMLKRVQEEQKFAKSLEGKTEEELEKIEEQLVEDADKLFQKIQKTEYELPVENFKEAATAIRYFLDKHTAQWQEAKQLMTMYEFWNPEQKPEKIFHLNLTVVLDIMGAIKFTGYNEWKQIVAVNEYLEPVIKKYISLAEQQYMLSGRHNTVIEKLRLFHPVQSQKPQE